MNERQLEQIHVDETTQLIQLEQQLLNRKLHDLTEEMNDSTKETANHKIRGGSNESFYESVVEYRQHEQELLLKYHTLESQQKRLQTLDVMKENPYFARIDFKEEAQKETLYLGIASLRDLSEETIVIDWRAPIANLYYEGEIGPAFYETDTEKLQVELLLKRQFKILEGQIVSMVDTSEVINDDFLLEILDDASSAHMKNIVATIQKAQNAIIRDTTSKVMLIEGIAGSGKTSALLQRIAFLLYHNRKWLDPENVLLFSPNHLFSDYISTVLPSLGESGVPTQTFKNYLQQLLPEFDLIEEQQQEVGFLSGDKDPIKTMKNSLPFIKHIDAYIHTVTNYGPLFREMKINGRTILPKESIRKWYQETNALLPLHQRLSLLQTKLLKKLGGLQKDETRQTWVKELAEEQLQELYASDPHLDYTEQKEKSLRKKLANQIVKKRFRKVYRGIMNYQFVNLPKQYLHFLQTVPDELLSHYQISEMTWKEHLHEVKSNLRQRMLHQEDAVLYFLVMRQTHPVSVTQKARYIFIDEMQDFAPSQVALLQAIYPNANLTFCGDLNQNVFGNETITGSLTNLFPDKEVTRFQLTTSYRSTKEITDFANHFLAHENLVETTARKGRRPSIVQSSSIKRKLIWLAETVEQTKETAKYWRTAIIGKTIAECESLYEELPESLKQHVQLITDETEFMKRSIVLLPAYLAKGLEFDRVFLWNVDDSHFHSGHDKQILYTMCTRAMHELIVFTTAEKPGFLETLDRSLYESLELDES
ncbi:DNA helicase IV [Enterococcus sp. 10A9_DIV0425]|uniref:DNA helicase IV n=1 Tax=Candidatus Enterococcus wittei TaxID=1987383 RepID=A0A242JVU5_9ENTE|nr:RNA polymerase recycling motor HelD [Enterococcus sp. 10A9_DIV0425]OTP09444.1 DNA helicase IV [Enterococcus sp. 10A9_DIV0425]